MALWLCTRTNKLPKFLHRRTAIVVSLIVGVLVYLEMRVKEGEKVDTREDVSDAVLGDKKLPGCIIIGVRKGGTRALLEMLTLHPSIRMAAQEVHFFDNDTNYARGYSWYLNQMPNLGPKQMAVEKSPSYLVTPGVAERIRAMDPTVRLLMIVREPVTRLVSDFTQITFNRLEKGLQTRTFDETIIRSDGTVNVDYYGVDTGLYSSHLERWYQHFPREQIHVVNGDRLIKTPWREISKIETFLGLEAKVTQDNFYFNTTKGFHCLRPGQGSERCLAKSKGRPHVTVSKQSITLLRRFYMPHNLRFYNLVGRDFGWPED
eukprot:TRINITY_DN19879_c0_g1_i1.p1 TRINITY_DN19879_c0_g1~~TRINITY_DN19879_c0_g1_i1.p1  ORF type:complete len:318 (-),score=60.56 TRINITY_DN19879_c0_g1_i1:235-1188(-)